MVVNFEGFNGMGLLVWYRAMVSKPLIRKSCTAIAVVLSITVAVYGLFLAFIGMPSSVVQEAGALNGEVMQIQFLHTPHALVGVLAATLLLIGLLRQKLLIAWCGLLVLFAYSTLFMFSIGAGLLPGAILLLILLIIIQKVG
jgi:hypothetical protein